MEAPEKIYLYPSDRAGEEYEEEWGDKPWGKDYVEYTHTDAFIKKAVEWLYQRQAVDLEVIDIDKFVKDFKKTMK